MKPVLNLFLDDERDPPRDGRTWVVARSYGDAVRSVIAHGMPDYISFDHDLGYESGDTPGKTGYDFAKWLTEYAMDNELDFSNFEFFVHSQNPVGKNNIERLLVGWLAFMREP